MVFPNKEYVISFLKPILMRLFFQRIIVISRTKEISLVNNVREKLTSILKEEDERETERK